MRPQNVRTSSLTESPIHTFGRLYLGLMEKQELTNNKRQMQKHNTVKKISGSIGQQTSDKAIVAFLPKARAAQMLTPWYRSANVSTQPIARLIE